ncbi:MAG TPA: hypothetical protein VEK57_29215 [Thermoanaerobaculia bacterium]|nr:hypothetical protein [Thermoanaerobaculia bacterium]
MERHFITLIAATSLFTVMLLLTDRAGVGSQLALGTSAALFLWFCMRRFRVPTPQILCAVAVATLGEVILSLGFGLYSYSHALIPFYVPPGHGILYILAVESTQQESLRRRERAICSGVLVAGTVIAVASLVVLGDTWGFLWWLGALALIRFSRNQLMLSTCFIFTIVLEWAGTANGNWVWTAQVPFVGLHSANPPSGVGILYILLDLIVMGVTSRFAGGRTPLPEPLTLDSAVTTDN